MPINGTPSYLDLSESGTASEAKKDTGSELRMVVGRYFS